MQLSVHPVARAIDETWHNLPTAPTTLIGGEAAIATIRHMLHNSRLLTLTGSGGSGKTRLALAAATSALPEYPDGVAWVDLAPLNDPALVAQSVANALQLHEQPQHTFLELLTDFVCDRRALVVLDNCEHLRAACAELVAHLLHAGAVTHILATSREPLAIAGEEVWPVPMLSVPSANGSHVASPARLAELQQAEAVQLFEVRARAVAPIFTLNAQNAEIVGQICRLLDGMPLAIELAAARANVLTPKQILARLDNSLQLLTRHRYPAPARHQTLRAALDWSFALLSPKEQLFFTRLSIFAGSFGVEAVEGICTGEGLAAEEMLDLLASLVEKSLVVTLEPKSEHHQEMRYRLLVPVRHYSREQLRASTDENFWRARHATWYLDYMRRAAPELEGAAQAEWLDRLEHEHDNVRIALAWFADAPDGVERGLALSCAVGLFWCIRSHLSEGQRWLEHFLQRLDPATALPLQVSANNFLARIAVLQSNFQAARRYYGRSITLGREIEDDDGVETAMIGMGVALWELGEFHSARSTLEEAVLYARAAQHPKSLARALNNLGLVCMHQGDNAATRAILNESLVINQQLGNKTGIATVLFNLAMLAAHDGEYVRARLLYEEALALDRELGNRSTIGDALNNMGGLAVVQGELAIAAAHFHEATQTYREIGALGDTGYPITGLGDIAFYQGDYATARARYSEALVLFREAGNQRLIARVLGQLGRIACRDGDLAAAAALCGEALTLRRTIGHKPGMVFILDQGMVELALTTGQPLIAARILGGVASARKLLSRPRDPIETRQLEPLLARLRDQLGEAQFAAVWAEGEAMSLDAVTAYALDTLSVTTVTQARPELRIFALGQTRVYRGDRLLTSADWTYAKARELLFYLLCRPNTTREQIGLNFWPDASAEQVRKRFSAALAHARNALGRDHEWIILSEGRYHLDAARTIWFDVDLFEAKWHAAQQLLHQSASSDQAATLLEEAIGLYQGDFAEEFTEGEWHQARRSALARAYLDALLALGGLHFAAERYAQAIATYQQALAYDPYLEEAHHELIRCYARSHKRSQAMRQFETLTHALAELDATPSAATQALIEQLRLGGATLDTF